MIFVLGNQESLLKSKFYNPEFNFSYPLEKLDLVVKKTGVQDKVLVVGNNNRIYDTSCYKENLNELCESLGIDFKFKWYELSGLNVYINSFLQYGMDAANRRFEKWKADMGMYEPNIKRIKDAFYFITTPFLQKKIKENEEEEER